jgi:hypothetical protein
MSDIITHPTLKMFTGPTWLMDAFQGYTKGNNSINIVIDAEGDPIINMDIETDLTWDLTIPVENPFTNEIKSLRAWLTIKDYKYLPHIEE